jgi:hypothetical protein
MARARRWAGLGSAISPSEIAASSATIGTAKASNRKPAAAAERSTGCAAWPA